MADDIRILILGGTAEARALAAELVDHGVPVLSSLAGRVSNPALPVGEVRIGGFGGADGLAEFLREHSVRAVIDATHPFAATMSAHAAEACAAVGVPLLRLARPGWSGHPAAATWTWVADNASAVAQIKADDRVLLTIGRQGLRDYLPLTDLPVTARVVEAPDFAVPPRWEVLQSRGPYGVADETDLMTSRGITVVVTKDSGGDYTRAKLDAATAAGARLIVISRPAGVPGVRSVGSVDDAVTWALQPASCRRSE